MGQNESVQYNQTFQVKPIGINEAIKKIKESIDEAKKIIKYPDQQKKQDIVILLGRSGAGKTTVANLLAGVTLESKKQNINFILEVSPLNKVILQDLKIGQGILSQTTKPYLAKSFNQEIYFFDTAGMFDNRGDLQELINGIYISRIYEIYKSIKILFIVDYSNITSDKGKAFLQSTDGLTQSFSQGSNYFDSLGIIVTRSQDIESRDICEFFKQNRNQIIDMNRPGLKLCQQLENNHKKICVMKKPQEPMENVDEFYAKFIGDVNNVVTNELVPLVNPIIKPPPLSNQSFVINLSQEIEQEIIEATKQYIDTIKNYLETKQLFDSDFKFDLKQKQPSFYESTLQNFNIFMTFLKQLKENINQNVSPETAVKYTENLLIITQNSHLSCKDITKIVDNIIVLNYFKLFDEVTIKPVAVVTQIFKRIKDEQIFNLFNDQKNTLKDKLNKCAHEQYSQFCIQIKENINYQQLQNQWIKFNQNILKITSLEVEQTQDIYGILDKDNAYQINYDCLVKFDFLVKNFIKNVEEHELNSIFQDLKDKILVSQIIEQDFLIEKLNQSLSQKFREDDMQQENKLKDIQEQLQNQAYIDNKVDANKKIVNLNYENQTLKEQLNNIFQSIKVKQDEINKQVAQKQILFNILINKKQKREIHNKNLSQINQKHQENELLLKQLKEKNSNQNKIIQDQSLKLGITDQKIQQIEEKNSKCCQIF